MEAAKVEGGASSHPPHLPAELWTRECRYVEQRRTGVLPSQVKEVPRRMVGLALSGGGIRSATTSLGVLQALARLGILPLIDYVSTVSGGGYIGTFLGALFQRWPPPAPAPAGGEASPPASQEGLDHHFEEVQSALNDNRAHPVDWLRENGRYLAPNGAGDLSVAGAEVIRNLVTTQVVLGVSVLAVLLTVNGVRRALSRGLELMPWVGSRLPEMAGRWLWWSPILLLAAVLLVLWVVPLGIAYWLVRGDERLGAKAVREHAVLSTIWGLAVLGAACAGAALGWDRLREASSGIERALPATPPAGFGEIGGLLGLVCLLALGLAGWVEHRTHSGAEAKNSLTLQLRAALVVTLAVFLYALVDSLGQTGFVLWRGGGLWKWFGALGSALAAGAVAVQRLSGLLGRGTSGRPSLPTSVVAGVAAALLVTAILSGLSATAHLLTWADPGSGDFDQPATRYLVSDGHGAEWRVAEPASSIPRCGDPEHRRLCTPPAMAVKRYLSALVLAWVLAALLGRNYAFVNRSSLSSLYTGRLTRAYLGASNGRRTSPTEQALSIQVEGDDLPLHEYRPWTQGGPLHLINATVNETVGGRSQVEQRDRKGMGMAIGPAGVSVGVRHHAAWAVEGDRPAEQAPGALVPTSDPQGYRVFPDPGRSFTPRWPSLGQWMAISGAAVSPGLGSRTSLSLSLLLGIFNVRLGYWWRSGLPTRRADQGSRSTTRLSGLLRRAAAWFPVQAHLLDELLARFPGTGGRAWYLTDGGHFENTGAYELIRRRLPTIILCDNGADPRRFFEDLANLVRKARVDLGAEVEFLSSDELRKTFGPDDQEGPRGVIGTLGDLGFAEAQDPAVPPSPPRRYAALARVTYLDGGEGSELLLLRPGMLHTEPTDVLGYHAQHGDFPEQSTADQFFDEAQWESYRCLGQRIATTVFKKFMPRDARRSEGWRPFQPSNG